MPPERVLRWDRGVDTARFDPSLRDPALLGGGGSRSDDGRDGAGGNGGDRAGDRINVLYSGRIALREGRGAAHRRVPARPRARGAPAPRARRRRPRAGAPGASASAGSGRTTCSAGSRARQLARAYASADLFLFPSATDTFGQVILEAQASGLPVGRRRRGRAALADRGPGDRAAVHGRRGACWPTRCSSWPPSPLLRERLSRAGLSNGALADLGAGAPSGWARVTVACSRQTPPPAPARSRSRPERRSGRYPDDRWVGLRRMRTLILDPPTAGLDPLLERQAPLGS